ncbi:hypothetical protein ES705_48500 [subsurface metagenome]
MSKRIFTKVFSGQQASLGMNTTVQAGLHSWLVQEDIEVIGAQAAIHSVLPSENDGWAMVDMELSQVGIPAQDGAILSVNAGEGWNTTPAGVTQCNGHTSIFFPPGFAVPVKEEGYLYVNSVSQGKSAGTSMFDYEIIVFYTKKGSR